MKYPIKNLVLCSILFASSLLAAPPPKYVDVDANFQQAQELEDLNIQQGGSMRLRLRYKVDGSWPTLTGNTARWEARQQMTNTSAYTATSNLTSNEAHFIQFDLNNVQTGTSLTNWFYSIILVDSGQDYPIGVGRLNVIASDFAGSSGVLVGSGYETNSVRVIESVSTLNFEDGFIFDYDGTNKLSVSVDSSTSGDITAVQVSGSILTVASGTGPIPIVGLTTEAVNSAESDPIWIAVSNTVSYLAKNQIFTGFNTFSNNALIKLNSVNPIGVEVSDNGAIGIGGTVTLIDGANTSVATFDDGNGNLVSIYDGTYGIDVDANGIKVTGSNPGYTYIGVNTTDDYQVEAVDNAGNIKAYLAKEGVAAAYFENTSGTVYIGDASYAINATTGLSRFSEMVSVDTDALAGTDAVNYQTLTNAIATLGGGGEVITTVTAGVSPYTATATTSINYINANTTTVGGAITVDLPDATAAINKVFHIKKLGTSGNVIVDAAGANTIDGQATITISSQWSSMHIVSDGNNWFIN